MIYYRDRQTFLFESDDDSDNKEKSLDRIEVINKYIKNSEEYKDKKFSDFAVNIWKNSVTDSSLIDSSSNVNDSSIVTDNNTGGNAGEEIINSHKDEGIK